MSSSKRADPRKSFDRGRLATNQELVERAVTILGGMNVDIMTAAAMRVGEAIAQSRKEKEASA